MQMIHTNSGDFEKHRRALHNLIAGLDEHLRKLAADPETVINDTKNDIKFVCVCVCVCVTGTCLGANKI